MIREIQDTDYEQVAILLQKYYPTHNRFGHANPHEIIGYLLSIKEESFIYSQNNQIVGFTFLIQNKQSESHSIYNYKHFAFDSETIGRELLAFCETKIMEQSETAKIELRIAENEKNINLIENMGYVKEATLSNHYRLNENCFIFGKTLMRE